MGQVSDQPLSMSLVRLGHVWSREADLDSVTL